MKKFQILFEQNIASIKVLKVQDHENLIRSCNILRQLAQNKPWETMQNNVQPQKTIQNHAKP